VDSMVIASVVVDILRNHRNDDDTNNSSVLTATTTAMKRLVAVHIDYCNRAESGQEAHYVENHCRTVWHIPCHIRRIEEMTRATTQRDEYERVAREIRYDAYHQAAAATTTTTTTTTAEDNNTNNRTNDNNGNPPSPIVLLGHHKGDLRENVLSNVHKGCTVLELSGMTRVSRQHGVTLWRPLLLLEKESIFDYAHRYGVPYFKDTTPHWSTRGKLRTKLLPLLRDVYGEGSMMHLSQLAVESDACRELVSTTVLRPFLDQVAQYPLGISFATAPWRNHGLFFWKVVLREALHAAGLGMFSDKMVVSFLERAGCGGDGKKSTIREGWLQCRRDYAVFLQQDGRVFVLYPSSFPWNKHDQYKFPSESVGLDEELRVGPWSIVARKVSETPDDVRNLRQTKAIPSFQHFMNGTVEYHIALHESGGDDKPLGFGKFSKANRPEAWKATDLKIQDTLPLLASNLVSQATYDEGPAVLVKVSLTLATKH
jgi:tRNA(Ile)-lysidine synthase TilS/MesJ